jgi:hypothetical protein
MGLTCGISLSLALGSEHKETNPSKEKKAIALFIGGLIAFLLAFLITNF